MGTGRHLRATLVIVALMSLGAAASLLAHHGWTGYDEKTPLTITGTIKASGYENPHSYVDLQTKDKVWHAVLAPPSRMESRGLTREMLKTGGEATVVGYQSKTDQGELRAERITIAGKTTELR